MPSWLDACRRYKELTGFWVVPAPGSKEHRDISKIYAKMKDDCNKAKCAPVAPAVQKSERACMEPERCGVAMIPISEKPTEISAEEVEAERARVAEAERVKAEKLKQMDEKSKARLLEEHRLAMERAELVRKVREMAPKTQPQRRYCKKSGKFKLGVLPGKVISFD